jgi:hypothetical protein
LSLDPAARLPDDDAMARRLLALLALLLAALAVPAAAQTPDEQRQLDWVQHRGRLLYEIDRAAWVTTDDLRARVPDLGAAGVRGWVVERDGTAYLVSFYAGEGDARAVLYRGRVENNRVVAGEVLPAGSRPLLTPAQRRLADARGIVARMGRTPCTASRFNVAIIPPETPDGPIDIYALTAQTENGVYPFGGHFRATVAPSGEILAQRAFTNSCLNLGPQGGGRGTPAALAVTHLLDPTPTEIHVFLSIWIGLPVFVGIGNPPRVWEVAGDRIRLVQGSN